LDKPDEYKQRLANNNKSSGKRVQFTAETICSTPSKRTIRSASIRRTTKSDSIRGKRHSPASLRTRAASHNDQSPSSHTSKCKRKLDLDISDKHEQPKNKARSVSKDSTDSLSIQTHKNVHPGNDCNLSTLNLDNSKYTDCSNSTSVGSTGNSTHGHGLSNSSLDDTNLCSTNTHTPPYNDFSTFIIHKSNFSNTNWKSSSLSTKVSTQPHFYCFDHGDHLHIVFPTKHHSDTNRTINRILKFFEGGPAGTAEAYTTVQLIRHIKQFIFYLIRYGLRNFCKFGTKINLLASYFDALDEPDSVPASSLEPCVAYIEQKKRL
jgi:hypothetical protein